MRLNVYVKLAQAYFGVHVEWKSKEATWINLRYITYSW